MTTKTAFFSNHQFLIEDGRYIGVEFDSHRVMLGDRVKIKGDTYGYISPGINREGFGTVVDITDEYTDHYFGIQMDNGQYGHVKDARIANIIYT